MGKNSNHRHLNRGINRSYLLMPVHFALDLQSQRNEQKWLFDLDDGMLTDMGCWLDCKDNSWEHWRWLGFESRSHNCFNCIFSRPLDFPSSALEECTNDTSNIKAKRIDAQKLTHESIKQHQESDTVQKQGSPVRPCLFGTTNDSITIWSHYIRINLLLSYRIVDGPTATAHTRNYRYCTCLQN